MVVVWEYRGTGKSYYIFDSTPRFMEVSDEKIFKILAVGLLTVVVCSGCSKRERPIVNVKVENTSFTAMESSEPIPTDNDNLEGKEYLIGIMGGRSSSDQAMWVSLVEDIEGIKKGRQLQSN